MHQNSCPLDPAAKYFTPSGRCIQAVSYAKPTKPGALLASASGGGAPAQQDTGGDPAKEGTGGAPAKEDTGGSPAKGGTGGAPAKGGTGGAPAKGGIGGAPAKGDTGGDQQRQQKPQTRAPQNTPGAVAVGGGVAGAEEAEGEEETGD